MRLWKEYKGHQKKSSKNEKIDGNIYTFDIETSSYLILNNKQLNTDEYLNLTKEEQENCKFQGLMYIWSFGINDIIYYGRTWEDLRKFLELIEINVENKKIVYVHNLSFEFQFLRNEFLFEDVFARKSHKVMKAKLIDFNIEFRCTLFLTNSKLEDLPKLYGLKTQKLVGNLDYSKIRTNITNLTNKELKYCENDCLILYEYIKKEKEYYKKLKKIPMTNTGKVRKELKENLDKNYSYRYKVMNCINTEGHIFNMLNEAFAGRLYSCKLDLC